MGGARCSFRDCHVSYHKFPRMHFFHFPLKEADRYKKWRQYAKMENMLVFTNVRRNNTCICARHFRPECFMNYKMDRLSRFAVPTLMRLSEDKALDFELDIENGVLVDLQKPTLKHLLAPDGFESPLHLQDDKLLIAKLNELKFTYVVMEYMDISKSQDSEETLIANTPSVPSKSVEIIESIQVAAPNLNKRQMKNQQNVKENKRRILNASNIVGNDSKNVSTLALKPHSFQLKTAEVESDEVTFLETVQVENSSESETNQNLFFTEEPFDDDSNENIEFIEVLGNDSQIGVPVNDTNVMEVKSRTVVDNPEYKQMKNDLDALRLKYSHLETENKELRNNGCLNEELKRKLLSLQKENNNLKNSLTDFNSIKEKLDCLSEENKTLKMESAKSEALKSELISRREENKELKKLLEAVRKDNKKPNIELEIKNKEIIGLSKKLENAQQELNDSINKLKEAQNKLNIVENQNKNLTYQENNLKTSFKDVKTRFDLKQNEFKALQSEFDSLKQNYSLLEQKCWKLEALQNQETTVSTSLQNSKDSNITETTAPPTISGTSLSKAQLFNGIKRYLCSSMVALLRMEMFGGSEREWKMDERRVAIDLLRLGEAAYMYFIDEWRIRLPALRDVRYWLNQHNQIINEEDL